MRIYITYKGEKHEGKDVTGVYTSNELAHEALGSITDQAPDDVDETQARWFFDRCRFVEVEEHEVTGITISFLEARILAMKLEAAKLRELNEEKIKTLMDIFDISRLRAIEIIREEEHAKNA